MSGRVISVLLGAGALVFAGTVPGAAASLPTAASETATEQQSPVNDQGSSPNYRSQIRTLSPSVPGVSVQVLQFSDRLQLRNRSGRTVLVYGYQGEPYARVRADGTVEVNTSSPAYYLNESFYGNVTVPQSASAGAPAHWRVVDRTGQFEWHDHRIHWMSPALPPQVKDRSKRTLIFDWRVPIAVGDQKGGVSGQLFWVPESSEVPAAAIAVGIALVALGALFVLLVRRRRSAAGARPAGSPERDSHVDDPPAGGREAW